MIAYTKPAKVLVIDGDNALQYLREAVALAHQLCSERATETLEAVITYRQGTGGRALAAERNAKAEQARDQMAALRTALGTEG